MSLSFSIKQHSNLSIFQSSNLILCLTFQILYFLCFNTIVSAESPLQIIHTDAGSLTFTFKLPDLKIETQEINGRSFSHISFESREQRSLFPTTMEIGHPRLPTYIQSIGIPDGPSPYVSIINARSEVRSTQTIIPMQPDDTGVGTGFPRPYGFPVPYTASQETDQPIIDHNFYREDRFHPIHLVEIVPLGFVRGQRIARLQINPIQYNPARKQLKVYQTFQVRIHFNQPLAAPRRGGVPLPVTAHINSAAEFIRANNTPSQPFEQLFETNLLNYQQAKMWRRALRSQIGAAAAPIAGATTEERYKIVINKTNIYKIASSDLKQAGADPAQIDLQTAKIENNGRRIGLTIFDQNTDGKFDSDDSIVFYGRKLSNNRFTNDNVYWLILGGVGSSAVEERNAEPKTPDIPIPFAFKKTQHFEEDRYHDFLSGSDIKSEFADHYFWTGLTGGDKNSSEKNIEIRVPNAIPRTIIKRRAELRIKFQGATHKSSAQHKAQIRLNNKPLGSPAEWKRQTSPIFSRDIDQRAFIVHDSVNILTLIAEDQNETPPGEFDFYLDWFELDYWHNFKAIDGALEFNSNTEPRSAGTVQYRVTNLNSSEIDVYQLQDGQIVARLVNGSVEQITDINNQITFETQVTRPTSFFVAERGTYRRVNRLTKSPPSKLRNPANQADYIVISHKDFINSIQPLAEFRKSQGLSVMVVDVQEIYDQFSHGIFNPFAIQKFLRYAFTSWQKNEPTYVLLVGDAHYDYKKTTVDYYLREYGAPYNLYPIYVPTIHGWAPNSGETAMDHRFVTVSGDDPLPDMFIGRLSVQTTHELDTMVKKIIGYEQNHQAGPWQHVLMQVADDDSDNVGDTIFEKRRDQLINEVIPVAYDTRKVYLKQIVSPGRTKQTILNTINEGAIIVEYSGHGGTETWADESILHISDVQGLRNKHLPFVITTTCLNGQFDKPLQFGRRSLSEQFMMGPSGAIGTLSATRLTLASSNAAFDEDLFKSMFSRGGAPPPNVTLGAIIGDAKINFMLRAPQLWIPDAEQYTLFGDPATRIALPELEIKVELEDTVLNTNKQISILQNIVGTRQISPITGEVAFHKATDFSTGTLSALALFPNDLDKDPTNDRPRRHDRIQVWQGDYGNIRLNIPNGAGSGAGIVRVFAFDNQRSAVGGAKFWMDEPVIYEVREDMDAQVTNTLNLSVQVIDDAGPAGIRSVNVIWDNTTDFEQHTTPMIPDPSPPGPPMKGGLWYKLQTPIPLPKGGRQVRYRIIVTDTTNRVIQTDRKNLRVPEGANIAFGLVDTVPLRYTFSNILKAHTLTAQLVNDGGRKVEVDVEVWFSEGNPDKNRDNMIDSDADVLGKVLVKASDWVDSDTALQKATVILQLKTPLSTGIHKVFVFADPESDNDDHDDDIIGKLDEPRPYDNTSSRTFIVNEFTLKANEELTAFSLDRVFDAFFPIDVSEPTSLAVDSFPPPTSFQPDIGFAAILPVAALRRGLATDRATITRAYNINLHSGVKKLTKPVAIKLRFDVGRLKDRVREKFSLREGEAGFDDNVRHLAEQMAIYAWREKTKAWKRLPSEIRRDEQGAFAEEPYITLTQTENTNPQSLRFSDIRIDANLTPIGKWIIFFLDSERYEILLQRKGQQEIEKLGKSGQLDQIFRDEILGLELNIPKPETESNEQPYEFGDVLKFETALGENGNVSFGTVSNTNRGNGTANIEVRLGPDKEFETADWLLFFTNSTRFELRNTQNEPVRYRHGAIVQGRLNQRLVLNHLGIEILVTSGNQEFELGDKIKYTTATVGVISTEVNELSPFTLMTSADQQVPSLQLWANGEVPENGSVIRPRPKISLFITDENGVDMDSFKFVVSKNSGPFEPITDFKVTNEEQPSTINSDVVHAEPHNRRVNSTNIPILYKPVLYIGRYLFRISVNDFNGNPLIQEFQFLVEEQPDFEPPQIEILANSEILTDGDTLHEQLVFEVQITDNHSIDPKTVQFSFGPESDPLMVIPPEQYDLHEGQSTQASREQGSLFPTNNSVPGNHGDSTAGVVSTIVFKPDLPNDDYQIQVLAADLSENVSDGEIIGFRLDEPIDIKDVLNVPNPMQTKTFFTYNLAQVPDKVTIKIYTVSGRLVRTLPDASDKRNYNETYWDGRDENGVRLANGAYFYRIIVEVEDQRLKKTGRLAILR